MGYLETAVSSRLAFLVHVPVWARVYQERDDWSRGGGQRLGSCLLLRCFVDQAAAAIIHIRRPWNHAIE